VRNRRRWQKTATAHTQPVKKAKTNKQKNNNTTPPTTTPSLSHPFFHDPNKKVQKNATF